MRFTPRFLPRNATGYVLTFLSLAALIAHSQDAAKPTPHVSYDGPALTFDFPGVMIGVAEYEEGPTGTTMLYFPKPVVAAVDVRGGAPGTVNTDVLRLAYDEPGLNAIVLSGGSSYGLSAATGVANALKDVIADSGNYDNVAVVAGAIIFDLGDRRFNNITPDDELGRAALKAARAGWCPLGARGAGRFAMQGYGLDITQHSGQGAAFRQSGDTKVLVVTVNNGGLVVDRKGQVMRCSHPVDGHCGSIADVISAHLASLGNTKQARADFGNNRGNSQGLTRHTTITVVMTNKSLPFWALQRLAVQVHTSMARGDQPLAEGDDGDTLFAVTTGQSVGCDHQRRGYGQSWHPGLRNGVGRPSRELTAAASENTPHEHRAVFARAGRHGWPLRLFTGRDCGDTAQGICTRNRADRARQLQQLLVRGPPGSADRRGDGRIRNCRAARGPLARRSRRARRDHRDHDQSRAVARTRNAEVIREPSSLAVSLLRPC